MIWNRDARFVVGADLGGTNIRAAVLDRDGKMLGHGKRPSLALEGSARTIGQIKQAVAVQLVESRFELRLPLLRSSPIWAWAISSVAHEVSMKHSISSRLD